MSTHSLPSQSFRPAHTSGFGAAVRDVAVAGARFVAGLANALRRPVRGHHRLSLIEEANEVRQLADTFRKTDPGFAADLMAAADRHEMQGEH